MIKRELPRLRKFTSFSFPVFFFSSNSFSFIFPISFLFLDFFFIQKQILAGSDVLGRPPGQEMKDPGRQGPCCPDHFQKWHFEWWAENWARLRDSGFQSGLCGAPGGGDAWGGMWQQEWDLRLLIPAGVSPEFDWRHSTITRFKPLACIRDNINWKRSVVTNYHFKIAHISDKYPEVQRTLMYFLWSLRELEEKNPDFLWQINYYTWRTKLKLQFQFIQWTFYT